MMQKRPLRARQCSWRFPPRLPWIRPDRAGITLMAVARTDAFEVFRHPQRIGACAAT
jgi:hypothetical protein